MPTGILWGPEKTYTVKADGQLNTADRYRPIVVAYKNGAPVRLGDLGRVFDSVQNNKVAAWFDDERCILLAVQRQPGTNTVAVSKAVQALLPGIREKMPASADLSIHFDKAVPIQESVDDVKFTLLLTLFLVVAVIFFFLRNASATLIPSLALPLSVVGTFAAMALFHFNLDNLSLMALTLAVGFVVDDAVVMLENIFRHLEQGKAPLQAAVDGSREVGFTIVSMTLSLVAVFIPILFLGGIMGRLFREFAVTIMVAILISGFVSLSLTPMMCSRFLKHQAESRHGRFFNAIETFWNRTLAAYEKSLAWVVPPQASDPGFLGRHPGRHDSAVRRHAQGFHSQRGHGIHQCLHGGRRGHLVRRHGPPAESRGGRRRGRSERTGSHVERGRHGRGQQQFRPNVHPPETAS